MKQHAGTLLGEVLIAATMLWAVRMVCGSGGQVLFPFLGGGRVRETTL